MFNKDEKEIDSSGHVIALNRHIFFFHGGIKTDSISINKHTKKKTDEGGEEESIDFLFYL